MATIQFVQALITLWNERVEYYNLKQFHGMTTVENPPQPKSVEGFMEFMRGQPFLSLTMSLCIITAMFRGIYMVKK